MLFLTMLFVNSVCRFQLLWVIHLVPYCLHSVTSCNSLGFGQLLESPVDLTQEILRYLFQTEPALMCINITNIITYLNLWISQYSSVMRSDILLLLLHLITHPTKCYTNSKVRALSEKTTLNKCVFKCFAKVAGLTVRSLNSTGNSFQQLGPATAKALKPQSVLWIGTTRSPQTADLKADRPEDCRTLGAKSNKVSRSETFKTLEH